MVVRVIAGTSSSQTGPDLTRLCKVFQRRLASAFNGC